MLRPMSPAERLAVMRIKRAPETASEREDRLRLETQRKKEMVEAEDVAIDNLIRENVRLFGP